MAEVPQATTAAEAKKPRQGRSPAFPFIALGKSLERAETFRIAEGGRPKHFAPLTSVSRAWGLGEKTGPFKQTVAALGHFSLFEFQGGGESRSARLTDTAFLILLDKQPVSPERDQLIKQVALAPGIHADLWKKWEAGLPSDPTLETYLVRDRGFSESGARDLIAEYKETIAFAKLAQPAIVPAPNGELAKVVEPPKLDVTVGDFIQVLIGGVAQFPEPKRVRAVELNHPAGAFVFVDGEVAGIPMANAE